MSSRRPAAPAGPETGQAVVELALTVPLLVVALLGVVQVALVARDEVLVIHAAREGARAAAVDAAPGAARDAALAGSGLSEGRLAVRTTGRDGPGSRVTVAVSYQAPTAVPLVGGLVGDVELVAEATMRVEQ